MFCVELYSLRAGKVHMILIFTDEKTKMCPLVWLMFLGSNWFLLIYMLSILKFTNWLQEFKHLYLLKHGWDRSLSFTAYEES